MARGAARLHLPCWLPRAEAVVRQHFVYSLHKHSQKKFSSAHMHWRLRTDHEDSRTLLLHPTVLPSLNSFSARNPRFAHLNQSYINMLLKKTTNANIYQERKKSYSEMRPCYCLKSGKPGISSRRLVCFQSCSNCPAVYASSKLPNIPLSTRCAFSVLKMWSCWSGRKVKNCWISLLGFGPLKHKSIIINESHCYISNDLPTQIQLHQNNRLKVIAMLPIPSPVLPRELNSIWDVEMDAKGTGCWTVNKEKKAHPNPICFKKVVHLPLAADAPLQKSKQPYKDSSSTHSVHLLCTYRLSSMLGYRILVNASKLVFSAISILETLFKIRRDAEGTWRNFREIGIADPGKWGLCFQLCMTLLKDASLLQATIFSLSLSCIFRC